MYVNGHFAGNCLHFGEEMTAANAIPQDLIASLQADYKKVYETWDVAPR